MSVMQAIAAPEEAGTRQPPRGLSSHAQALWRRAERFRRLADDLAAADSRELAP